MNRSFWRSLRTRLVLLAILTCAFLAIAAGSFYSFLRSSHAATVQSQARHLARVGENLVQAYAAQVAHGASLLDVVRPPAPPPPPPHLPPHLPPPAPHGRPPAAPPVDPLSQVTASVLQREDGIEGGFLAGTGPLVGYAFPTHEGPGSQNEMPQRERPTIDELAREAEATGAAQTFVFEGSHDVVLFYAQPVRQAVSGQTKVSGAVWLMERLPDLNRGRSKQLLFASLGFGTAALITALLTWFVLVDVRGGVSAVTRHLEHLQQDLSQARQASAREHMQLEEFERVLTGIDAMAVALQSRIENERDLEDQLRHKERLSSLGQFAAGVAHELRNPLATIRLRAQMAQQGSAESIVARSSSVILEEVDRLDAMIGRLLSFSRPILLDLQEIDLGEFCRVVVASWKGRLPGDMSLRCEADEGLTVIADRSRLLQVLDNLVENAVQASQPSAGQVTIRVSRTGESVRIDVIDSGSGFSSAALKQAFDPFFTTKDSGTGLGLSIAFELVQAHGGELCAVSRPEGGAIVSISLPALLRRRELTTP